MNRPYDPGLDAPPSNEMRWLAFGQKSLNEELVKLSKSDNLRLRLAKNDEDKPLKRIYIMGCGRSGTWLLTALFSTFQDVCLVPNELPVEYFGVFSTDVPVLVMKRSSTSYQTIETIPPEVEIVMIVRHPYDVLTSHHPHFQKDFYIAPHRWLGEMLAVRYLLDIRRPNTMIIRYEDLVANPEGIQEEFSANFDIKPFAAANEIVSTFKSPAAAVAMHGLRPIDQNSVCRFRNDPNKMAHLRSIRPRLGSLLDWTAETFGYDISL